MRRIVLVLSLFVAGCYLPGDTVRKYYPDGTLQAEYTVDDKGQIHGERKMYHPNGRIESVTHFYHGDLGAYSYTYDTDGRMIEAKE